MRENWLILIKRIAKLRIKTSQDGSFELRQSFLSEPIVTLLTITSLKV